MSVPRLPRAAWSHVTTHRNDREPRKHIPPYPVLMYESQIPNPKSQNAPSLSDTDQCDGEIPGERVSRLRPLQLKCFPFANVQKWHDRGNTVLGPLERSCQRGGPKTSALFASHSTPPRLVIGMLWELNKPLIYIEVLSTMSGHNGLWNVVPLSHFYWHQYCLRWYLPQYFLSFPSWMFFFFHCCHQRTKTSLWSMLFYLYL